MRKASQAHFGRALEAGVKIHEYGPAMLHAKTMVVDGEWVSIGSANLDNRSFAINNELNVTFLDRWLARRLTEIFEEDLKHTTPETREEWQRHRLGYFFYLPLVPLRQVFGAGGFPVQLITPSVPRWRGRQPAAAVAVAAVAVAVLGAAHTPSPTPPAMHSRRAPPQQAHRRPSRRAPAVPQ